MKLPEREGKGPSPKSTYGTSHPENQAFSNHGVSLSRVCSPEKHHMGFLNCSCSPGLQGGWPTLLKSSRSLWF